MMRSFGLQTLTGSAQPIFGDVLTAAFVAPPTNQLLGKVQVAATGRYQVGDRIILGAGNSAPSILLVTQISSGTVMLCKSEGDAAFKAWANSTIIMLEIACAQIMVKSPSTNAGTLWLGTDNTVTNAGGGTAYMDLVVGSAQNIGNSMYNSIRTSDGWMAGTANDKAGVVAIIV